MSLFKRMMLAVALLFGVMVAAPSVVVSPAYAQSSGGGQDADGFYAHLKQLWGDDNAAEDNTKHNLDDWKKYFQNDANCWGCKLFSVMTEVTLEMGKKGSAAFAGSAASAVSAFMGLWVVWQLYLMLSVSHANSPAQSIDTIVNRLVVMMVVLWVLKSDPYSIIMTKLVLPSMDGLMGASVAMMPDGAGAGSCVGGMAHFANGERLLCAMHHQMGAGVGLGAWMIDGAEFSFFGKFEVLRAIAGALIMLVFAFMMIIMPFRFFDALVRIATVSAILPIVVLAYLFKPTRGACKQAATSLLASGLTFLFTSIAIGIAVSVLQKVTYDIVTYNYDTAGSTSSWFGPIDPNQFMVLITAALGMAVMILQAGGLAAEFAGFQGSQGGAGAAGAAAATLAVSSGASFATGGAAAAGGGAARGIKSGAGKLIGMGRGGGGGGDGGGGGFGAGAPTAN